MKKIKNKTVFITGAARGLGAALCRVFGKEKFIVLGCDIRKNDLLDLSKDLDSNNIMNEMFACNISNENEVNHLFNKIKELGYTIDVLINNAGITRIKLFEEHTASDFNQVMNINFMGAVWTTKAAYSDILKNKGTFIAISSVAGFAPLMGRTAYAASKHALLGFYETLRTEVKEKGAHVLIACPGFINTQLRDSVYNEGENNQNTKLSTGKNASPEAVALKIYKAYIKKDRMIVTGLGTLSLYLKRFFPKWYDKIMIQKMEEGFIKKGK